MVLHWHIAGLVSLVMMGGRRRSHRIDPLVQQPAVLEIQRERRCCRTGSAYLNGRVAAVVRMARRRLSSGSKLVRPGETDKFSRAHKEYPAESCTPIRRNGASWPTNRRKSPTMVDKNSC